MPLLITLLGLTGGCNHSQRLPANCPTMANNIIPTGYRDITTHDTLTIPHLKLTCGHMSAFGHDLDLSQSTGAKLAAAGSSDMIDIIGDNFTHAHAQLVNRKWLPCMHLMPLKHE